MSEKKPAVKTKNTATLGDLFAAKPKKPAAPAAKKAPAPAPVQEKIAPAVSLPPAPEPVVEKTLTNESVEKVAPPALETELVAPIVVQPPIQPVQVEKEIKPILEVKKAETEIEAPLPIKPKEPIKTAPLAKVTDVRDLLKQTAPKAQLNVISAAPPSSAPKRTVYSQSYTGSTGARTQSSTSLPPPRRAPSSPTSSAPGKGPSSTPNFGPDAKKGGFAKGYSSKSTQKGKNAGYEDDAVWDKFKRKAPQQQQQEVVRPQSLRVKAEISVKDLAVALQVKAAELIRDSLALGSVVTLTTTLTDTDLIQLLGQKYIPDFGIDRSEEERLNITDKSIAEEIAQTKEELLRVRSPVVTFMGHVDHGKTSLIDKIRSSNRVASEAGGITQHIGAFRCQTSHGPITILDTPGHEAFTLMRERGASATDIVVLVVAGDQGVESQTVEVVKQARVAGATIIVAINKSDSASFDAKSVKTELTKLELFSEEWGGETLMINCSAKTGEGLDELLENIALQAEMLQLKACPSAKARGVVLEAQMDRGLGALATVLVQNGTLKKGDPIVFSTSYGRIKLMQDEFAKTVETAGPAEPIRIIGLSAVPEPGDTFIVVSSEKEARDLAEKRSHRKAEQLAKLRKMQEAEKKLQEEAEETGIKILNLIIKADVQGSCGALEAAIKGIESKKAKVNILYAEAGALKASDVSYAYTAKAHILCSGVPIDKHIENEIRELQIPLIKEKVIYDAIDAVKAKMKGILDKIPQEVPQGKARVKATFKSSKLGLIAGCEVIEGSIHRKNQVRVVRKGQEVWKGALASIRSGENDVAEIKNGLECGLLLRSNFQVQEGDIVESIGIIWLTQEI